MLLALEKIDNDTYKRKPLFDRDKPFPWYKRLVFTDELGKYLEPCWLGCHGYLYVTKNTLDRVFELTTEDE